MSKEDYRNRQYYGHTPKCCICVPVHNRPDLVGRLIDGFNNSEAKDVEQIFVDDASNEETKNLLVQHVANHPHASYLRNSKQSLFTRTINRAIRSAQPDNDFYVLVNSDVIVKPGWLNKLMNAMLDNPNAIAIGYYDGIPGPGDDLEPVYYPSRPRFNDYVSGHLFACPAYAFSEGGLFPAYENGSAHINSEKYWQWGLLNEGREAFYLSGDEISHNEGGGSWARDLNWLWSFPYETLYKERHSF